MLPKIWKKLLLAICIIACLFNVTAKLVNRISLEKVIASEQEGVNVRELLNITDEQPVVTKPSTNTNTVSNYTTNQNEAIEDIDNEENISEEDETEETKKENKSFFDKIMDGSSSSFVDMMGN